MQAETIYQSTAIYTVTRGLLSGGVAVSQGRILAADRMEHLKEWIGAKTEIIDLKDRFLMPGFIDGHTHLMPYAPKVDLSDADSIAACVELVRKFYETHKETTFVRAEKWYEANWDGSMPTRYEIDPVLPDVPFLATDLDSHKVWVNSCLLKQIGITKETVGQFCGGNPDGIQTDANGEPTGLLRDQIAMETIIRYGVPTTEENVCAALDQWTQYGVTAVNEMDFYTADCGVFRVLQKLEAEGRLHVRVFASLDAEQATDEAIAYGKKCMHSDRLRLNALKAFLDGTGSGLTAYMLEPYLGTQTRGRPFWSREQLLCFVKRAARHGLAMHTHCCGDAAVRMALDVYAQAAAEGVRLNPMFSLEHCDTVAGADLSRPAALGISLNMTPDFLAPTKTWKSNPYLRIYGPQVQNELWRIQTLLHTGANVSFGTDYTASSMNPMDQLYRAVERKAKDGNPAGGFLPAEKLTMEQALFCYTMGSAKSVGMEEKLGSLDAGKYADMIVLDRNLLREPPSEARKAKVVATLVEGKRVYGKF